MTITYYGRRDDAGRLVGLFRATLMGDAVVKGELLDSEGWMRYPELLRYLYVTGDVTAQDQVEPDEARAYIAKRGAQPDEVDLGVL